MWFFRVFSGILADKSTKHQPPSSREHPNTNNQIRFQQSAGSPGDSGFALESEPVLARLELEIWSFSGAWRLVLGASMQTQRPDQTLPGFVGSTKTAGNQRCFERQACLSNPRLWFIVAQCRSSNSSRWPVIVMC